MGGLCILIPTFEKYRAVAEFTRSKIDQHWSGHPPIFLCGLPGEDPTLLTLRDDPSDWMKLVRTAVADLQTRGFCDCYLILDDHPPMGLCHTTHLNETLPRLMAELGASFINLQGWGQHRPLHGKLLGSRYFYMEKPDSGYLWKFALHPGLWNLQAFGEILDVLLLDPDPNEHTCWKFERRSGCQDFALPARLRDTAYRISGIAMTARRFPRVFIIFRRLELFSFDVLRFLIRILGGQAARHRCDSRYLGVYHFYDGPYPLFWSGLMKKGRLNPDLLFFLRLHHRHAELAELQHRL